MASTDKEPKKRLGGTGPTEQTPDPVQKYLTLLKDYQNVVFAVVVLVLTIGVLAVWSNQRSEQNEEAAWYQVAKSRDHKPDEYEALLTKYEGTTAHPFLSLSYAAKLYERGNKADLEKAKSVLERAKDELRGNQIMTDLVTHLLVGIEKELGDASLWVTRAKGDTAPETSK